MEEHAMRSSARPLAYVVPLIAMMSAPVAAPAQQQASTTKVTTLLQQVLADYPGHEVLVLNLDIPPGAVSSPHRHPGHHVFGYVLEGCYRFKVGEGPETVLSKGQTFYEAPGQLHAVSGNASQTEPAKVLAFMVAESGKPITVPEKQ
jgi:quercetin dioxygenase-like cupin family protein